jgi:hypothetical protein
MPSLHVYWCRYFLYCTTVDTEPEALSSSNFLARLIFQSWGYTRQRCSVKTRRTGTRFKSKWNVSHFYIWKRCTVFPCFIEIYYVESCSDTVISNFLAKWAKLESLLSSRRVFSFSVSFLFFSLSFFLISFACIIFEIKCELGIVYELYRYVFIMITIWRIYYRIGVVIEFA